MALFLWILTSLVRWVRLKIYQYEVTFAIYMLTPTEKFIFSMCLSATCSPNSTSLDQPTNFYRLDSLLLTLITMIATGIYIYLPDHLRSIYAHMYYYAVGERPFISSRLSSMTSVFGESATRSLEVVYETAKNTAATTTTMQRLDEL
jgi:hypothetical protein